MRFLRLARAAALGVCLTGVASANADSLTDVIPAEAKVVVVVNNIDKYTKGYESFVTAIGQQAPNTDLAQVTQFFGEIGQRWKLDRGLAIAVMQPAQDGVAVVFPVDDGAATLKGMMAEMQGDVGKFDIVGQSAVGMAVGKHVVVSAGEGTVKSFKGSAKTLTSVLSAEQRKLAAESAVYIRIDVQAFKPMIQQGLENADALKQIFEKIAEKAPNMNADQMAQAAEKVLKAAVENAQAIYITQDVGEQAVKVKIGFELLANSPMRQKLAAFKPSGAGLFGSLPAASFIAAIGADVQGMAAMNPGAGDHASGFGAALAFDGGLLSFFAKLDSPKAAEQNEALKGMLGFGAAMAAAQTQGKVEIAASESTVGGAKVGQATIKVKEIPPKGRELMTTLFGGPDLVFQHGVVGNALGFTITGKADGFAVVQKTGALGQESRVTTTAGMLPKNTVFALMVDPMTALYAAKTVMAKVKPDDKLVGLNVPSTPGVPVGLGITLENDGAALQIVAPSAALKNLVPLVQQLRD